jgi:hypothetical protein
MADFWDEIGSALKGVVPVIQTVAPTVASALGGPLAGMAVQALSNAILGKPDGAPADIAKALTATPPTADQLLALKKQEEDFTARMEELGFKRDQLVFGDRDSARTREAKTGDSLTPRMLAGAVTVGFFGILALMMFHEVPASGRDVLLAMTGTLGTAWVAVVSYYFGSSAGSSAKTDQLAALANRP